MRRIPLLIIALALAACTSTVRTVSDRADHVPPSYVATRSLADLPKIIAPLPRATTLVVLDIDDTLLTTPFIDGDSGPRVFFGSDSWYSWQAGLGRDDPEKVACVFPFLAINYESSIETPTESDAADVVASVASDKLILTSRSPDYRGGTERELKRARIPLPAPITTEAALVVDLGGTPATYEHGVYMTRGGDKGIALFALLARPHAHRYTDVVLVDDGWKNIVQMNNAVLAHGLAFHGLLYTGVKTDPSTGILDLDRQKKFEVDRDTAQAADTAWRDWLSHFGQLYPERARRFASGEDCR